MSNRDRAKLAALNALRRARRAADLAGVDLTEWEGEFLGSVTQRVATYGRAFCDPEKGDLALPLSRRQGRKLMEIRNKGRRRRARAPA